MFSIQRREFLWLIDPPGSGNGGILLSDEEFGDFELELEMNPGWGADTGVFSRRSPAGDGFQMYVDYHNGGNVGHLRGEMAESFAMKRFQIFAQPDAERGPKSFFTRRAGSIGLQIHQGTKISPKGVKCRWRNLRIKRL